MGSLCNDYLDCPYGDDELLCDLKNQICPSNCVCFLLTVRCINVTVNPFVNFNSWPYNVVLLTKCTFFIDERIKRILVNIKIFVLRKSGLRQSCSLTEGKNFISVDFSFNFTHQLETGCFENMDDLSLINLTNNFISNIH